MRRSAIAITVVALGACTSIPAATMAADTVTTRVSAGTAPTAVPSTTAAPTTTTVAFATTTTTFSPFARPTWLGTRPLPLRADEHGEVQPTPPELVDRRFETLDLLPPPADEAFHYTIGDVPPEVVERSTYVSDCPVALDELSYLTMSHWGFDGRVHTGEMVVNGRFAADIAGVFGKLFDMRFPMEQVRVITAEEVDAPPTGDWNDTTSFVCRPAVGSGSWSMHASGLAIDINPFQNPYEKGDLVLPELASAYLDRSRDAPGIITTDVVEAFAAIGWGWGGDWQTLKDWMHFSSNGR